MASMKKNRSSDQDTRVSHDGSLLGLWSDLTMALVEQIAERLSHVDLLHFSAVCKSWHSVIMENRSRLPFRLPMCHCLFGKLSLPLLLQSYNKEDTDSAEFLCLSNGKVYGEFFLPELRNKRIAGSSKGWLVTIGIQDEKIHLLNPLTKAQIPLGPLYFHVPYDMFLLEPSKLVSSPFRYVCKAILSSDPKVSGDNCIVMAIVSTCRMLSYSVVGDYIWVNIRNSPSEIEDVIYYKGKFYATDNRGVLVAIEGVGSIAKARVIAQKPKDLEQQEHPSKKYLVESSNGELLLVCRRVHSVPMYAIYPMGKTVGFDVFKLELEVPDKDHPSNLWVKLESLGEEMIFLGNGSSICIPSDLYPSCKGNYIYFMDDDVSQQVYNLWKKFRKENPEEPVVENMIYGLWEEYFAGVAATYHDNGIYDMADGSILSMDRGDPCFFVQPVWLTPKPW